MLKDCGDCNKGRVESTYRQAYREDGDYSSLDGMYDSEWNPNAPVSDPETCNVCKGHGILSRRMHAAYKTEQLANRYRGTKAAMVCYICEGVKKTVWVGIFEDCRNCDGNGQVLIYEKGKTFLPEDWKRTSYFSKEFKESYNPEIIVVRQNAATTWNEAHLGIGYAWSCTDYGKAWESDDDYIINEVKDGLKRTSQYSTYMNRETRQIADRVFVVVKPNSYYVVADGYVSTAMLPPTYTAEVLNKPVL